MAFHSTLDYGCREDLLADLERHGGLCDCQSSRDVMVYAVSAEAGSLDPAVAVLAETVLRPRIRPEELRRAARNARYEVESLLAKPEQDLLLMDLAHSAAFGDATLGLPKVTPQRDVRVNVLTSCLTGPGRLKEHVCMVPLTLLCKMSDSN